MHQVFKNNKPISKPYPYRLQALTWCYLNQYVGVGGRGFIGLMGVEIRKIGESE